MPVRKFKSVAEMKGEMKETTSASDPALDARRIKYAWSLAAALTKPRPRGVRKYRSLEEAMNSDSA